jgi:hypothetical protein
MPTSTPARAPLARATTPRDARATPVTRPRGARAKPAMPTRRNDARAVRRGTTVGGIVLGGGVAR